MKQVNDERHHSLASGTREAKDDNSSFWELAVIATPSCFPNLLKNSCASPPLLLKNDLRLKEQHTDKSPVTCTIYHVENLDLSRVPKNKFILATPREVKMRPDLAYVPQGASDDSIDESNKEHELSFYSQHYDSYRPIQAQESEPLYPELHTLAMTGRIYCPAQEMDSDEELDYTTPVEMTRPVPITSGYCLKPKKAARLPEALNYEGLFSG